MELSLAAGHAQRDVSRRAVVVGVEPVVLGPLRLATAAPSLEVARDGHA